MEPENYIDYFHNPSLLSHKLRFYCTNHCSGWQKCTLSLHGLIGNFFPAICNVFLHGWKRSSVMYLASAFHLKNTQQVKLHFNIWKHFASLICLGSTHWGRVTFICVGNLTIIDSNIGLSSGRHQAIIWAIAKILVFRTKGTIFFKP